VRTRIALGVFVLGWMASSWVAATPRAQGAQELQAAPASEIRFHADVLPILQRSCITCHGGTFQFGNLDLSTREGMLAGGGRGPAIVPGRAQESPLYRAIAGLDQPAMPLDSGTLPAAQVELIRAWIDQGAVWDLDDDTGRVAAADTGDPFAALRSTQLPPDARDYWAFIRPVQAPLPEVRAGFDHPIDRFLEAEREALGLRPAPRADRRTLLRRASLDLIGLPPAPAEIDAFLADTAPGAWERAIDRLLASPHYGERWGRHWLDVARYADSGGYQNDTDRPHFWRYRDYVIRSFNDDKPYDHFIREQIAGDEFEHRTDDHLIATGFLRAGPRVQHREKDNPERRHDYLDDVLGAIGKGVLGLTLQCARCHDHKFDPILTREYYSLQASLFGYVEVDYPLGPREEADAYLRAIDEIFWRTEPLRAEIEAIEEPYRYRLALERIRERYPEHVVRAVEKPASERSEGERLLAEQVLESAVTIPRRAIDTAMTPEDAERKRVLTDRIAAINAERPRTPTLAHIVTDGDWRATGPGTGDGTKGACPVCEEEYKDAGRFLELGPGPGNYVTPPSFFLVRGDPDRKAFPTEPGFLSVITEGAPPTVMPPADGRTSGRRLALAHWLTSPDNPLTARVMVNRIWHHHFGRGIVATLDNFGRMGESPTNQTLLDWLAVEFMNQGWSIKQMHRIIMTSEAYQMVSEYADATGAAADPANARLWRYPTFRLEGEIIRDAMMAVAGTLDRTMGGPPIFPHVDEALLESLDRGIWRNRPDGPEVWRRSVYIYGKRSLPFPMLHVFDLADMNVSFGARSVSTVPTQALTLMNNAFVQGQAQRLADRLRQDAGGEAAAQVELAYELALGRPPTDAERALALELIETASLEDFTLVMLNLSEFVYTR
jgi:hypothetical protein